MSSLPIPAPLAPGFTHTSLGAALTMLSERLGDRTFVYWSAPELRQYVTEALRTWQAYTGWYLDTAALRTAANQTWYDLATSLDPSLLAYSVTDTEVASVILYHLLERQLANGASIGTDQFDLDALRMAIQNRLNRFLGDSGMVLSYVQQQSGLAPPASRALIPASTIDVRRVAWIDTTGRTSVLWKESEWSISAFLTGWELNPQDPPMAYSQSATPPTSLLIAPAPLNPGLLELLLVQSGPTVTLQGSGVVLAVPDDFAWGVKWGALADLLSADGQAKDIARAVYCEQRYQECVQLAVNFPAVAKAQINDQRAWTSSIFDLDAFKGGWQNTPAGTPTDIGLAGRNLLALSPAPLTPVNPTLTVIRNMPIPASDGDYLQVPPDVLPSLLDYAQHLASFKMGGENFQATEVQRKNFILTAALYNERLRQLDFFRDATRSPSQAQQAEQPRTQTPLLVSYQPNG